MCTLNRLFHTFLRVGLLAALIGFLSFFGGLVTSAQAATTASGSAIVTATVSDIIPPTNPVLISPSNGALITNTKPTFVWQGSTDASGILKYQLWLDGNLLFDNIPTGPTSNAQYSLTVSGNQYSLTPVNAIADGTHTWKVRAFDFYQNAADSATWTFTIDSQAPTFVLTNIGGVAVSISAQDPGTIPTSPIALTNNEPLLTATGEANSTVQTTLIIPGFPTQFFTNNVDAGGSWSLQLGVLPLDLVMTLNFTITDQAGNVSVLNGVQFYIADQGLPTPTPSPLPSVSPGASPSPGVTPTPTPSVSPSPTVVGPTIPSPSIGPPQLRPRERTITTIQQLLNELPFVIQVPEAVRELAEEAAPFSGFLLTSAVPIASTIVVASQFGFQLSPMLLIRIIQALGLIPVGKPQGLVFDSETGEGVPFALITIRSNQAETGLGLTETVVTDTGGVYKGVELSEGTYVLETTHQEYRFPTQKNRPPGMSLEDYYRGETFTINSLRPEPLFLIPVDALTKSGDKKGHNRWKIWMAQLSRFSAHLLFPLAAVALLLAVIFPSWINWLMVAFYAVMIAFRIKSWLRVPRVVGTVIDDQGQPLSRVIVRLYLSETSTLAGVIQTDEKGVFTFYGPPAVYQISLTKPGMIWAPDNAVLSLYSLDASQGGTQHLTATMTRLDSVYDSLFGKTAAA